METSAYSIFGQSLITAPYRWHRRWKKESHWLGWGSIRLRRSRVMFIIHLYGHNCNFCWPVYLTLECKPKKQVPHICWKLTTLDSYALQFCSLRLPPIFPLKLNYHSLCVLFQHRRLLYFRLHIYILYATTYSFRVRYYYFCLSHLVGFDFMHGYIMSAIWKLRSWHLQ